MTITVDPATFVISVLKSEMTLVQSVPTVIYELNLNDFRLALKDWEDDQVGGITFLKTHIHNTEVLLSGVTYARVIEILAPYTVTFEDDQYAVNLVGANSNVADKVNVNQVSVRSQNSAGLISITSGSGVTEQDKLDIADRVWDESIDEHIVDGTMGTGINDISYTDKWVYVDTEELVNGNGKSSSPFNNFPDAVDFAETVGWRRIFLRSDATLDRTLKNFSIEGIGLPTIDFNGQNVDKSEFSKVKLTGQQVGAVTGREVVLLSGLTGVNGIYKDFGLAGDIEMADNSFTTFASCSSLFSASPSPFIIDMGAATTNVILNVRKMSGAILIQNINTATKVATFEFAGGRLVADNTNTAGVLGVAGLPDTAVDIDDAISTKIIEGIFPSAETNADAVWDEDITTHTTADSVGKLVQDTKRDVGDAQGLILST